MGLDGEVQEKGKVGETRAGLVQEKKQGRAGKFQVRAGQEKEQGREEADIWVVLVWLPPCMAKIQNLPILSKPGRKDTRGKFC